MEWFQVLAIAGSTVGACIYLHREHRAEMLNINNKFDAKMDKFSEETRNFHGRLCALEEKYIQMMQRFMEKKNDNR